jgi:hypothetical protein
MMQGQWVIHVCVINQTLDIGATLSSTRIELLLPVVYLIEGVGNCFSLNGRLEEGTVQV